MIQRPSVFPVAVLFVLAALAGCAQKQPVWSEQDKQAIIQTLQQSQIDQATIKNRLDSVEYKLVQLERDSKRLEAENKAISASLDSLSRKRANRVTSTRYSPVNQKLSHKLEKIESSIRSATNSGAPVIKPSDKSIEKNGYTAAYLALKSGRHEEAVLGFKALLNDFPKGEYADQAWFWLGESYFSQNKMKQAIKALDRVANDYPDSAKHPAALLKLASAYQSIGRRGDAIAVLKRLIEQHPDTNAAEQARVQLNKLESGPKQ